MANFRADFTAWGELSESVRAQLDLFVNIKRNFLRVAAERGMDLVRGEYIFATPTDRRMPTRWTGRLGEEMLIDVAVGPKRSRAVIRMTSPYAAAVEGGRGPGGVPPDVIKQWAQDRLGLDPDGPDVRSIIAGIRRQGIVARNLFGNALGPNTPSGQMYTNIIIEEADKALAKISRMVPSEGTA